ncbi:MAG: hypothetical protein H3C34_29095, partial [Caldilineaceae bacterium]|nr:hypothetical protein [Caldilineaceae bacterium]
MKHHAWLGQGKWWIGLAVLLLAALLLLPAVTAAQDDIRPDPDAPDQFVFLPFVQSGPAPEPVAGDVIPGQYIVVLQPPEVRAANNVGGQALGAAAIAAQVAEV